MTYRCAVLTALFVAAFVARATLDAPRVVTTAQSLRTFPAALGQWTGQDSPLEPDVVKVAAVNDHLNRTYRSPQSSISLYIGYYQSQRQGEALHSPLFCLPGSGWQPVANRRIALRPARGTWPEVNQLVVERGLDRLLVLYWYQTSMRVTASEYWRKLFLMRDAFFAGRTDVALVRVIAPIAAHDSAGESSSLSFARPFAELVLPEVQQRLFRD